MFSAKRSLLGILLLAILTRIIWAIAVPVDPVSDSNAYDVFAKNLASGFGYGWQPGKPTAYWPVGTSFIYSLFYRLLGHSYIPIVLFNIFLAIITILTTMYLANKWFGHRTAVLSGLFLAIWPGQVQFTTILASELIFTALVLVALAIWLTEAIALPMKTVLVGCVLAGACYVKPLALLIPILFWLFQYSKERKLAKSLVSLVVMLGLMAVLIAPWSYRNYQAFEQFSLISTNGGANFWMGNNPDSTGGYMPLPKAVKGMNEAAANDYLKDRAVQHIKEKPLLFVQRSIKRIFQTYGTETIGIAWNEKGLTSRFGQAVLLPLKLLSQLYWMLMLGLALLGAGLLCKRLTLWQWLTHPTILLWGYYIAVHAIIVSQDRYHYPSVPFIAILAGFSSTWAIARWLRRTQPAIVDISAKRQQILR
ncbi:MAG TPA: glycosyltransferase family 39 protein [Leptolyngbyaceae cyanobacterium M33_DOE_097]|uniref:Glycosyl transferase family 39 n=1 Tax=Oscillatoriales cyanobacterium SpSt-418 TaxID=2282169 RepID=A0A7C3PSW7_9CYAN|nr:glycosyltransferase family 39 protein [Leptolyngbyaceae cyanobacterium M33_DOE_097]